MEEIKFRNLEANELEVRKGRQIGDKKAELLIYKNSRIDMAILDEFVGNNNWAVDYKRVGDTLLCGIGIYSEKHKAFIWKWAAGSESSFEKVKGEQSDALKRAGFVWNIGRSLYTAPKIIVPCENEYESWSVDEIDYTDDKISDLVISDSKGNIVFNFHNGKKMPVETIDTTEVLKVVCGEMKQEGGNVKELLKFYNYYLEKIKTWDNVNEKLIRKLWEKWNSK